MEFYKYLFLISFYNIIQLCRTEFHCLSTPECLCSTVQASFDIQCPFNEPQIVVRLQGESVEVNCITKIDWNTQHLPELNIDNVDSVSFSKCPLPLDGFLPIINRLGINGTSTLKFILSSDFENITLTSDYFRGLENLERLVLSQNNIRYIDGSLFRFLNKLKEIDLRDNRLELSPQLFEYSSKLKLLDLSENKLTYLPEDLFQNLTELKTLFLFSNRLRTLNDSVFEKLRNLSLLELSSNLLEDLPENVFAGLKNLKKLSLMKNNLKYLPENLFGSNDLLEVIRINRNPSLTQLPDGLFANLTKLNTVLLNDCKIVSLESGLFEGAISLQNMSLDHNEISHVSEDVFQDLTELQNLDLTHNKLESLPDKLFAKTKKLITLNLQYNLLGNLTRRLLYNLQNLERINLKHNKINHIDFDTFKRAEKLKEVILASNDFELSNSEFYLNVSPFNANIHLEKLDLSNNRITAISEDWLYVLVKLNLLDLSHNKISYIGFRDLIAVSSELTIDLSYNEISTINFFDAERLAPELVDPNAYSSANIKNTVVYLNGNPIDCNCFIYDFSRYFDRTIDPLIPSLLEIRASELTCAGPKDLAGISIEKVKPRMLSCPLYDMNINVTCPESCVCSFRPWDKSIVVDCAFKNLTNIPKLSLPEEEFYNQTHVYLQGNRLSAAPVEYMGYENVTNLILSHNNISEILWVPPKLQVLRLDNNNVSRLNYDVLVSLNNSRLTNISLGNNPWQCDCLTLNLSRFLVSHLTNKQIDASNIKCTNNGKVLVHLSTNDLCPAFTELIIALSVTIAVIALISAVLTALFYHFEQEIKVWLFAHNMCLWFVTEEEVDKDKLYDAFISYSHKDEDFIMNKLLPVLEQGPQPYKLCLHIRDWIAGEFIPKQIARSVEDSRRTLVILSPHFLKSIWGKMEFRTAHTQAMSEGRARVIIILYGEVDLNNDLDDELKAYIKTNTYVKWGDPWFWNKLRYALPHSQTKMGKRSQKSQNIMISLNDKLDLINGSPTTPNPGSTPPAINIDPLLLKNNPLNFTPSEALTPPAECGLNPLLVTVNK